MAVLMRKDKPFARRGVGVILEVIKYRREVRKSFVKTH